MCTPTAAIWATVIGTGVSVYSSLEQARYNKEVAASNATTAEYQAQDAIQRGDLAEKQQRLQTQQLIGKQKSAIAGSGFTIGEGSAEDTILDTAALGEEDVFAIRSNAAREAWSYRVTGTNALAQGQLAAAEGRSGAATSLLSGTASVADKWYKYNKAA